MTEPDSPRDHPAHWSQEAVDAFEETLDGLPEGTDLQGPAWAVLVSIAELLTVASALEEQARAANYLATGSAGQVVTHPAVDSARAARVSATQLLARLIPAAAPDDGKRSRSDAARSLARKRWGMQ